MKILKGVSIVLALLAIVIALGLASPGVITVDDDGPADFSSIQAAIEAAQPGDTIQVAPGLYQESLRIDKNDLNIVGAGSDQTVIESEETVVAFVVPGLGTLSGFTLRFKGSEPRSAVVVLFASPTISDNVITGATLSGVELRDGAAPSLRDNLIEGNGGPGILLDGYAGGEIVGNKIVGNGLAGEFAGIEVREGSEPVIQRNIIEGNRASGIFVHDGPGGEIQANTIITNGTSGIVITNAFPELSHNTVLWNGAAGLFLGEGAEPQVAGNFIARHPVGVFAQEEAVASFSYNLVLENETDYQGLQPTDDERALVASIPESKRAPLLGALDSAEIKLAELAGMPIADSPEILRELQQIELLLGEIFEDGAVALWTPHVEIFFSGDQPLVVNLIEGLLQAAKVWYERAMMGPDSTLTEEANRKLTQAATLTSTSIIFDEETEEPQGIILQQGGDHDTETIATDELPRTAHRTGNGQALPAGDGNQTPDRHMQFDVDDALLFNAQPTSQVMIAVEFLDVGADSFTFEYDAQDTDDPFPPVTKTNSGAWKWALFVLDDALFSNRMGGGDFRIDDLTDGSEIISSVVVLWLKPES